MPKSERDETVSVLTSRILAAMLDELVMDATLQSHHEVARSKVLCPVCKTRCGSIHTPGSSSNMDASQASISGNAPSRAATPSSATSNEFTAAKANATGTSTPTSVKADGNLYMECMVCLRQIASNRYAPHLASCMGLNSARRGAVRTNSKPKQSSEAGRSASPMSESGNVSDNNTNGKGKAKSKGPKPCQSSISKFKIRLTLLAPGYSSRRGRL